MKSSKIFSQLIFIFIVSMLFTTSGWAFSFPSGSVGCDDSLDTSSNNSSPGVTIDSMNNITTNQTACVSGSSASNDKDYYNFTVNKAGTLKIDTSSPNGHEYHFQVQSSVNGDIHSYDTDEDRSLSFDLVAGEKITFYSKETGSDTDYWQVDLDFTTSNPYGGEAESICYGESTTDGDKTTTPINSLEDNLESVIVYFDTSSLFAIPFFNPGIDDCSVDDGAKSDNCEEHNNGNTFGPVSMFNNGGWTFDLGAVSTNQDHSISTYDGGSFFDKIADLFSSKSALKATYVKDGFLYTGTIASCGDSTNPPNPSDEPIPTLDAQPQAATCDSFADMFQTRGECSGSSGGSVAFTNAGSTSDGSSNIIINSSDNEINTCQVTVPDWVANQYETCGENGDCQATGIAAESLTINYENIPSVANVSVSPTSSTDDIVLTGTTTLSGYTYNTITTNSNTDTSTTFEITNQLKINTLKMTTGNTFAFNSADPYSLEIGNLGIENNGVGNTIITDANAKNIKINTFDLPDSTTLALTAEQTLQMDNFSVGRNSNVILKAQYVNINSFTSSNTSSTENADSEITIYADYIDIGDLTLNQTVTLAIYPYTPGKRILFRTNTLEESSSSPILISSGNYYVNSSLVMPGTSDISALRAVDGNQIINFYINTDFNPGNNPGINALGNNAAYDLSLPAANFMLFVNGNILTGGGGTTINATMYIEGDANFGDPSYIKGAISAQNITIGQGQFTYDQSLDSSGFGSCENTQPDVCMNYDSGISSNYINIEDLPDEASNIESVADIIQNMNHVDENRTACIYGSSENGDYDYYYFQADVDGRLQITRSSPNGNDYHLKITTDNGYTYGTRDPQDDPIETVGMHAGDTIYFRIKETGSNTDEYQLDFNFIVGGNIPGDRPFTIRNPVDTRNIKGNYVIGGSLSLCEDDGNGHCRTDNGNSNSNDDIYVDIDGDDTTSNSSSFVLEVPNNAKVLWAGLYWQGVVHRSRSEDGGNDFMGGTVPSNAPLLGGTTNQIDLSDNTYDADKVKFLTPSSGGYITVSANQLDYSKLGYGGFADVTGLIDIDNPNGTYMLADVKCHEGAEPNHGNYGAWSLIVIYRNEAEPLRNLTIFDGFATIDSSYTSDLTIEGFLTPSTAPIKSRIAFFTMDGEGGHNSLTIVSQTNGSKRVESLPENPADSLFNSTVTGVLGRLPDVSPMRFDLDIIDIDDYLAPLETSATLQPRSTGDRYTASFFAMSTDLYEPRVCYYIDSIVDTQNVNVFEDGAFTQEMKNAEPYTFNIWISNMKKDINDSTLEDAQLVQVFLNTTDFTYTQDSTAIKNLTESSYLDITDIIDSDIGEFDEDSNTSTWRIGYGPDETDRANGDHGGTLAAANGFADNSKKAFIHFNGYLHLPNSTSDINLLDYLTFKASFRTNSVVIEENDAQLITQCQDLNLTGSSFGISGAFNVVNPSFLGNTDPLSTAADQSLNAISTQISNKPMSLMLLALDPNDNSVLKAYDGDVNVSIIITPNYIEGDTNGNQGKCEAASAIRTQTFTLNNQDRKTISFTNMTTSAYKNVSFKMGFESGGTTEYTCSRDVFSIRPEKFVLTSPNKDIELLHSGVPYNFSLVATQFNTLNTATPGYNVTSAQNIFANIDANKVIYAPDGTIPNPPLAGTLAMSQDDFNISNGLATNIVAMSFDDVGKVKITLVDQNWAQVDIDNGDTNLDCNNVAGNIGAYVCGDIDAIFIPDHFSLTAASVVNANATTFTYLSSDLNMSAGISLTIKAENALNAKTTNFDFDTWEKPVDIDFTIPSETGLTSNPNDINETVKLNFIAGEKTITYSDTNTSANLVFNYNRNSSTPVNPFKVNGADITLTALSTYASSAVPPVTDPITGTVSPTQSATFIYGRTHAPRQRFASQDASALIYYEAYCNGIENGRACDKTLLPGLGIDARYNDDFRWFINDLEDGTQSSIGNVTQKTLGSSTISISSQTAGNPTSTLIIYDESKGYPYKTTMQNSAPTWLLYNKYTPNIPTNEFEVEFINPASSWAGQSESENTTKKKASSLTNRRSMW